MSPKLAHQLKSEQEILKKFEELGYVIERNPDISEVYLINKKADCKIVINKFKRFYYIREFYTPEYQTLLLQEHQLLTELFRCYGWFDETNNNI